MRIRSKRIDRSGAAGAARCGTPRGTSGQLEGQWLATAVRTAVREDEDGLIMGGKQESSGMYRTASRRVLPIIILFLSDMTAARENQFPTD